MEVRLRALEGDDRGRQFRIPTPLCIVGRGQECDLRLESPGVSRRHCAILVMGGSVVVSDLKSRNGTFVNDERIVGDRGLKGADTLRFGPRVFEILVEHSLNGDRSVRVKSVTEEAQPIVSRDSNGTTNEDNVSDWLDEADPLEIMPFL